MIFRTIVTFVGISILCLLLQVICSPVYGQHISGERVKMSAPVSFTTAELMLPWINPYPGLVKMRNYDLGLQEPDLKDRPQAPGALQLQQWPPLPENFNKDSAYALGSPQTVALNFTGATLSDAGAFPPDVMGAVGPTQFVVFINGRLRSFNKSTGIADGVLNADPDAFFASVLTPPGTGQASFTSDPNVRYDRLSGRWFLTIIDVTVNIIGRIASPNRVILACSDGPVISGSTIWSISYYQNNTYFDDYPSLGIDANALYIGTDQFQASGSNGFYNTRGYVINKASVIAGSPTVYVFDGLLDGSAGPYAPRGVDNDDPNNTGSSAIGYFIGVDAYSYGLLMMRQIYDPGGSSPTISANISIPTTLATSAPVLVPHKGNTGGANGRLDALDDRLFAARLKNGSLWTAQNIGVNSSGTTTSANRNASQWYEIQDPATSPSVLQVGKLYDNNATNDVNQRNYWIPSIAVSGQGHAALGCSIAGTNEYINCFTTGRLAGDAPGTLREGPGGSSLSGYTNSSTAYNPSSDPGGSNGRRWGDYSFVSVDPDDDMTMWTIQEFCSSANIWGVRVVKLLAPPPVTPEIASPAAVAPDLASVDVVISGSVVNGSGFFDPGAGFQNHITASLPGGIVVNSVTYTDPTHVTVNLNTTGVADGYYTVTVTNPDGQSAVSTSGILQIDSNLPVELSSFTVSVSGRDISLKWRTESEVQNYGFEIERRTAGGSGENEYEKIAFIEGHGNSNIPNNYTYTDNDPLGGEMFFYRLKQIDNDGNFEYSKEVEAMLVPGKLALYQNYPNPFNPSTTISYYVPEESRVQLKVYNILSQEVAAPVDEFQTAGKHNVLFNSAELPSGVYFYRVQSKGNSRTMKMVILK